MFLSDNYNEKNKYVIDIILQFSFLVSLLLTLNLF